MLQRLFTQYEHVEKSLAAAAIQQEQVPLPRGLARVDPSRMAAGLQR